jgi:hypothetical protein
VNIQVPLSPGERKTGVTVRLAPGAAINGRITDPDGDPLTGCIVQLTPYRSPARQDSYAVASGSSDDLGEYRVFNIPSGRYLVSARCPHPPLTARPLTAADDTREIPRVTWGIQYYPSAQEQAAAAPVSLTAGADVSGMDFRMRQLAAVDIRGTLTAPGDDWRTQNLQVQLINPNGPAGANTSGISRVDSASGRFELQSVLPGSYTLIANAFISPERQYAARQPIIVGTEPITDLKLALSPGADMPGRVEVANGAEAAGRVRIVASPAEPIPVAQVPQVETDSSGSFILPAMLPGLWHLSVQIPNPKMYVQSVWLANRQLQGRIIDTSAGVSGPLRIVLGTRMAALSGNVSGSGGAMQGRIIIAPASADSFLVQREVSAAASGHWDAGQLPPGRYRLYAVDTSAGRWNPLLLEALKDRAELIDLGEGATITADLRLITSEAIEKAIESFD